MAHKLEYAGPIREKEPAAQPPQGIGVFGYIVGVVLFFSIPFALLVAIAESASIGLILLNHSLLGLWVLFRVDARTQKFRRDQKSRAVNGAQ